MPDKSFHGETDVERSQRADGPRPDLVGCAGWSPISGALPFSEMQGSQLERYASVFHAVEINSSFYRPHRRTTYARWAASVPQHFRFSVKLPRAVSHALRLANADALMAQFEDEIGGLEDKLGCILVQLPPSLPLDLNVADIFFKKLRANQAYMIAFEARHASWFGPDASAMLNAHGITRVVADPPQGQCGPHVPTTPAMYIRLHGSPRMYYSSYSDDYLAHLADALSIHRREHTQDWTIFDNTASGAALANALAVLDMLKQRNGGEAECYARAPSPASPMAKWSQ